MSDPTCTAGNGLLSCTSLDTSETNGKSLEPRGTQSPPPRYAAHRAQAAYHARYQKTREQILDALDGSTFGPIGKQRERIANCCLCPLLVLADDGKLKVAPGVCRQRMCPTCQARRGRELTARVASITAVFNAPRLITLTIASTDDTLKHTLDRLYAWYRELRRSPLWKDHVTAAVAVAEVTRNPSTGLWHPHIHIIADGTFMPQSALAAEWERVTNGSRIVDIRAVHDRRNAAQYVAAYVAKPTQVDGWPPDAVNEFAYALRGRRMLITSGKAHRTRIPKDECETRPSLCEPICTLPRLLRAERGGCPAAALAVSLLHRSGLVPAASLGYGHRAGPVRPPPLEDWEWEWLIDAARYVAAASDAGDADACPFPDPATTAALPPRARPEAQTLPSPTRCTSRVDFPVAV